MTKKGVREIAEETQNKEEMRKWEEGEQNIQEEKTHMYMIYTTV
jgi:hypothetical protein